MLSARGVIPILVSNGDSPRDYPSGNYAFFPDRGSAVGNCQPYYCGFRKYSSYGRPDCPRRRRPTPLAAGVAGRRADRAGPPWRTAGGCLGIRISRDSTSPSAGPAGGWRSSGWPAARNPVFFRGQAADSFHLQPGEHFVIGETTFTLTNQRVSLTSDIPQPVQQHTFSAQYLKHIRFRNPDCRIEVLSRLPEAISEAPHDAELCVRLASMLLAGIPRADTAAIVAIESTACQAGATAGSSSSAGGSPREDTAAQASGATQILHWDQRLLTGRDFEPSERLIREAIRQEQSVLHVWRGGEPTISQQFTAKGNVDWAFCTPIRCKGPQHWAIYVAGRFNIDLPNLAGSTDPNDLREDVKFAELVANAIASLRQMRALQQQQASLSQFFSPVVLHRISEGRPRCGSCPSADRGFGSLLRPAGIFARNRAECGQPTRTTPPRQPSPGRDDPRDPRPGGRGGRFPGRCRHGLLGLAAAPSPTRPRGPAGRPWRFAASSTPPLSRATAPLAGFHAGIGIASGPAVAGKIGTVDQAKVTVFGPVVNLASRLEGLTKILRAPILLDEATARVVRQQVPREVARVRRLAVVRPYGLDTPLEVSELLPPAAEYPLLTDEHLVCCERALDAFLAGRWSEAYELLHRTPTEDQVTDFLTGYIAQHKRTPPKNWDGIIPISSK